MFKLSGDKLVMISTNQRFGMCDVCRICDFNTTDKQCFYCGMCDAWICAECSSNWPKRLKAAIKRKLEPGYKGLENYTEVAVKSQEQQERERV